MVRTLTVIDGWQKDAAAVRAAALAGEFRTLEHDGHAYRNVGTHAPADMEARVHAVTGRRLGPMLMSFFRLTGATHEHTSWIHADTGCGRWAALWYLTPDGVGQGGTAFWRHRAVGWAGLPSQTMLERAGLTEQDLADRLQRDADDMAQWQMEGLVTLAWNRLVIYPTRVFHSPWPRAAFGTTKEDSRLVWVGFFN